MSNRFWAWYERRLLVSITFVFVVHIVQIPHMIWNCDQLYGVCGNIAGIHPLTDFLFFGVDLLEIPSIINVTFLWLLHVRKRYGK